MTHGEPFPKQDGRHVDDLEDFEFEEVLVVVHLGRSWGGCVCSGVVHDSPLPEPPVSGGPASSSTSQGRDGSYLIEHHGVDDSLASPHGEFVEGCKATVNTSMVQDQSYVRRVVKCPLADGCHSSPGRVCEKKRNRGTAQTSRCDIAEIYGYQGV